VSHFHLNHPRNYLIAPIAAAHRLDTASLIQKYAAGSGSQAKTGAEVLGLIDSTGDPTTRGQQVISTSESLHGSLTDALVDLHSLHGSSVRFTSKRPAWANTARDIALTYHPAQRIGRVLRENGALSLPQLVKALRESSPDSYVRDLFIRERTDIPLERLVKTDAIFNPSTYKGTTVFQLKTFLFHTGVVRHRGVDTKRLDPEQLQWHLTEEAEAWLMDASGDGDE